MQRFIFDLDGTLLIGDFRKEREYFKDILPKDKYKYFINNLLKFIYQYEDDNERYDTKLLSKFLSEKIGYNITEKNIKEWIEVNSNIDDELVDGTLETLEYLKRKGKSLVVLTNWFSKAQISRLKNANILEYFDEVYGGEIFIKPLRDSFYNAQGIYPAEECVMIGDNIQKDVYVPLAYGLDAVYYNPGNNKDYDKKLVHSIQDMRELKERY